LPVFYNNLDVPGQISKVTSVLSEHNVNIASLNVARQFVGSPALSIIRCDTRIPQKAIEGIRGLEGIFGVQQASF
jgi:L-serine dehydratase